MNSASTTTHPAASMPAGKRFVFDPAVLFLIVGLLVGGLYCVAIPYGAGFDEEAHLVRIYDISGNNLIPNHNPPTFRHTVTYSEFHDLSYQRRDFQTPAFDMFTPESLGQKLSRREENVLYNYDTNSIYSPLIFLPQAVILRLGWRTFDFPILPVIILARLAGLLLYLAGSYLAIRLLPYGYGKWALAVLALSPMALFQAASLSTDGFLIAASFLFVGLTLYVYAQADAPIKPVWIWALVGVSLLLGSAKPGAIVLLPLLLLLPLRRFPSKKWVGILALGALLAILLNVGWTALVLPSSRFADGDSPRLAGSLGLITSDIGGFLWSFTRSVVNSFGLYLRNWIASYGYWVGVVPPQVYWFYGLALLLALVVEPVASSFQRKARAFLLGLFLLASGIVIGLYFSVHYKQHDLLVEIRQGRYSIPHAPLLLAALCGLVPLREGWRKAIELALCACLLVTLGYYSFGFYAVYYTDCGYPALVGGKCTLPIYKNLEVKSAPVVKVNALTPASQTFTSLCSGLESVQVFVKSIPQNGSGTLRFTLFDANHRKLAGHDFAAADIRAGEYLTLPVDPPGVKGANYEILLEAPDLPASRWFEVAFQVDNTHEGNLKVAGEAWHSDLVFHYTCTAP